jgi:hypothetical protein
MRVGTAGGAGVRAFVAGATAVAAVIALAGPAAASPRREPGRVSAQPVVAKPVATRAAATYRVFATREGLVGGTTANGHVITERDHFVALPSRLGLSVRGGGERSVRVCTDAGRCAYAPVWDVGPWNTTDDYWNVSRQSWTDLPRGVPAAQAAYTAGYNGGRDEFDREVANPAGIDLGDGTFWDALRLTDNSWVTVTFVWLGGGVRGRISSGGIPVNLRAAPTATAAQVGLAGDRAELAIECQVRGQRVTGTVRTTNLWNRVARGTYVSHAYVATPVGFKAPTCR